MPSHSIPRTSGILNLQLSLDFFLHLLNSHTCNCILTIENESNLFQRGTLGFDIDKVDKDALA